jgi:hypothetical protein
MYLQSGHGVMPRAAVADLTALLQPVHSAGSRELQDQLQQIVTRRCGLADDHANRFAATVTDYLLRAQSILRAADAVQSRINRCLGRPAPVRPLSAADIDVHNLMQGPNPHRLPFLTDELARLLDVHIELDTQRLVVREGAVA